ncbi:MAG: carcinine hydrolase/isopenicillin-N N-acyltransferase family protein, partial [Syntrophomonadaceae bacterium]|nr:carcinine hydrolase/isopenicillin-N N-acyltransferase family protein [Syntrophomonadaceae bacterium]
SSAGFGICGLSTIEKEYSAYIPVGCYLPKAIRQQNITEAMNIFKQVARGVGYYQLADAKGQMFGFESIHNGDFEIIYPEDGLLFHSNHYLTKRFQKGDIAPDFILDSFTRLDRICSLMHLHYGAITPEIAMEILADHDNHPDSICRHSNPNVPISTVTLISFIMLPEEGVLYISSGHPCEHEFVRYAL